MYKTGKLLLTLIGYLSFQSMILAVGVDGKDNSSKTVEFTNYSDGYSISASALSGWIITSANISGGSSGTWSLPSYTFPRGSVTATGTRDAEGDSSELFSARLYGSIVPVGGEGSTTYTYSVSGNFKGDISVTPSSKIVPLGGGGESYRLLTTYDGVAHHISGYWRTTPNRSNADKTTDYTWHGAYLYYGGVCTWPGQLTVEGAAHSDGGDSASATLRVVAVSSITATPSSGSAVSSNTDGWQRNSYEEYIKDDNNNNIPEEIPIVYTKQARVLALAAASNPSGSWPTYGDPPLSYPTWSITGVSNSGDYFSSLNGASSGIKAEKAFGSMQINTHCGNTKKINSKFIRVKFGKKTVYKNWNVHDTLNVSQFLAGNSSFTGCATPSTCTDLDCNHRGCYDQGKFAWSVSEDAQLKLSKGDGTTVYAQSFSPADEAAKTDTTQRLSFSGYIRFKKTSLTTTADVTVTATSEELATETDSLTVTPQYINLTVTGAEEEAYDAVSGELTNTITNEGSIGAFVIINDNDTNDDKNVDREKSTEGSASDSDLLAVTVNKKIDGPIDTNHPVTLTLSPISPATSSSIKVWKDASRSELYISSSGTKQFTSATNLGPFYIEAVGSSSAKLSVSYTYPNEATDPNPNNDYSSTNYFNISGCGDNIRLNGFGVDLDLAGLDDQKTVKNASDETVRVLPYELFPGGEVQVRPDISTTLDGSNQIAIADGILTKLTLAGTNLKRNFTVPEGQSHVDDARTVTFTSESDKIKLYEPVTNEQGEHLKNSDDIPLYKEFNKSLIVYELKPKEIYLLPVKDSASKRDVELKMSYTSPQNAAKHEDVVKLTCLMLDLDVDSNNNGTVEKDNAEEDKIETTAPGKILHLNNGDLDGDNIVDNVDYNINGNGFTDNIFAKMILRIPKSIDLNNCKITLSYDASMPPATEGGTLASSGSIRIWKKMSNTTRDPKPIGGTNQTGDVGGDYVMPTNWTVQTGQEAYYTPTQLLGSGNREVTLYIEGVSTPTSSSNITVSIVPIIARDGTTITLPEATTVPENYNLSDAVTIITSPLKLYRKNTEWTRPWELKNIPELFLLNWHAGIEFKTTPGSQVQAKIWTSCDASNQQTISLTETSSGSGIFRNTGSNVWPLFDNAFNSSEKRLAIEDASDENNYLHVVPIVGGTELSYFEQKKKIDLAEVAAVDGTSSDDANSFYNAMPSTWKKRGIYCSQTSNEADGTGTKCVELGKKVDMLYIAGHSFSGATEAGIRGESGFGLDTDNFKPSSIGTNWSNGELEWLILAACNQVNYNQEYGDDIQNNGVSWLNAMPKVHCLMGYRLNAPTGGVDSTIASSFVTHLSSDHVHMAWMLANRPAQDNCVNRNASALVNINNIDDKFNTSNAFPTPDKPANSYRYYYIEKHGTWPFETYTINYQTITL